MTGIKKTILAPSVHSISRHALLVVVVALTLLACSARAEGFEVSRRQNAISFGLSRCTLETKATLVALVIFSMVSCTIIAAKFVQLRRDEAENRKFFDLYRTSPNSVTASKSDSPVCSARSMFDHAQQVMAAQVEMLSHEDQAKWGLAYEMVELKMDGALERQVSTLHAGQPVLVVAANGGPFIGLFGTVWGVLDTFCGIARFNTVSLTATAPGMAGALVATMGGLMVAIPALFAHNFLARKGKRIAGELKLFRREYLLNLKSERHMFIPSTQESSL